MSSPKFHSLKIKQIKRETTLVLFFSKGQFRNAFTMVQRKTHRWIGRNLFRSHIVSANNIFSFAPIFNQGNVTWCAPLKASLGGS